MKLLDVNVLLHAYNPDFPDHQRAKRWLEEALSGADLVGLAWITIVAFLRIATSPRGFPRPLEVPEAVGAVSAWLAQPVVRVLEAGERHWTIMRALVEASQARGNLANDAHLAALALEHGATVCTNDRDFSRFPALRTLDPLSS